MSASMSNNAEVSTLLPASTAAGLPSAAATAATLVASPTLDQAYSASLVAVSAASVVLSASAHAVLPNGVIATPTSASVVELQAATAAALPSSSSADSTKSLALLSPALSSARKQSAKGPADREIIDKNNLSSPSHAPIGSAQGEILLAASPADQCSGVQPRSSTPAHVAAASSVATRVGDGGSAASGHSLSSPSSPLDAVMAAVALSFNSSKQLKTTPSSAAQHHAAMCDVDGAAAAGSPSASDLAAWSCRAATTYCLITDISLVASSDADRKQLLAALVDSLSAQQRIDAVLSWLPALAQNGLAWVCAEPRLSRLHLHFRELAHVVHALKAAPLLVRCGALPNRWSDAPCGVARHEHPEALVLSCVPTEQLPNAPGACDAAVKTLLTSMGIGWQSFWQSHKQQKDAEIGPGGLPSRVSYYVLTREADPAALVPLVGRVHRQHKLFGGLVSVQGHNTPQLVRCNDCHELGHGPEKCPIFGGTAVRLLFKNPLSPALMQQLRQLVSARSAMLGNSPAENEWRSSHKATLFFDLDLQAQGEVSRFQLMLMELVTECGDTLLEEPRIVPMSLAARNQECTVCGCRDKDHQCPFRGGVASMRPQQQQQQKQPPPAKVASAATVAAGKTPGVAAPPRLCCIHLERKGECKLQQCAGPHPQRWVVAPPRCCRDFYHTGTCNWGKKCKREHTSSAEQAGKAGAALKPSVPSAAPAAAAAAAITAAAPAPKAAPAPPSKGTSRKRTADTSPKTDASSSNRFAALGGGSRWGSPSRVPTSSLSLMASPPRRSSSSNTTSAAAAAAGGSASRKHQSTAAANVVAADADGDEFQIVSSTKRARNGPSAPASLLNTDEHQPMEQL